MKALAISQNSDQAEYRLKLIRSIYGDIRVALGANSLMALYGENQTMLSVFECQFKACGLEWKTDKPELNQKSWKAYLDQTPSYSEVLIPLLYLCDPDYWGGRYGSIGLETVGFDGDKFRIPTEKGDIQTLPMRPRSDFSLVELLAMLSWNKSPFYQMSHEINETFDPWIREKGLNKASGNIYVPNFHAYLNDSFLKRHLSRPDYQSLASLEQKSLAYFESGRLYVYEYDGHGPEAEAIGWHRFLGSFNLCAFQDEQLAAFARHLEEAKKWREINGVKMLWLPNIMHSGRYISLCRARIKAADNLYWEEKHQELSKFQESLDEGKIEDILTNVSFKETTACLLAMSKCRSLEEFSVKYPNLPPAIIAFLSLFDLSPLDKDTLAGINLYKKGCFGIKGASFQLLKNGSLSSKKYLQLPYTPCLDDFIKQCKMRFIDISLYLDKLKERLSLAFSGKLIPDRLSNFFDLNTKNALPKSVADKINEQIGAILPDESIYFVSFGLDRFRLFDEHLKLLKELNYEASLLEEINILQAELFEEALKERTNHLEAYLATLLDSKELKVALYEMFKGMLKDPIESLNDTLQANSGLRILTGSAAFLENWQAQTDERFLSLEEASLLVWILSWFPPGALPSGLYITRTDIDPDRKSGGTIKSRSDLKKRSRARAYLSTLENFLKTSDTGIVYRKQGNSLSFAEMYFSAAATGHEEIAIKAIVKNLIDWVIDYHDLVSLCKLDRKKISKILLQYLHYRLGQLDETQINKDTRNHFQLFEECFRNRKKIT